MRHHGPFQVRGREICGFPCLQQFCGIAFLQIERTSHFEVIPFPKSLFLQRGVSGYFCVISPKLLILPLFGFRFALHPLVVEVVGFDLSGEVERPLDARFVAFGGMGTR